MHPHVEIVALGVGPADVSHVGIARDARLNNPDAFGGGCITALAALWRCPIEFSQQRVVDLASESGIQRVQIRLVAVRSDLWTSDEARSQIVDKFHRSIAVASSDMPAWHKLRLGIRGKRKPCVASVCPWPLPKSLTRTKREHIMGPSIGSPMAKFDWYLCVIQTYDPTHSFCRRTPSKVRRRHPAEFFSVTPKLGESGMSQVAWKGHWLVDFSRRQAANQNQGWDGSPDRSRRVDRRAETSDRGA